MRCSSWCHLVHPILPLHLHRPCLIRTYQLLPLKHSTRPRVRTSWERRFLGLPLLPTSAPPPSRHCTSQTTTGASPFCRNRFSNTRSAGRRGKRRGSWSPPATSFPVQEKHRHRSAMAEEHRNHEDHQSIEVEEVKDRGFFDFMGKKDQKVDDCHDQEVIVTEFEKVKVEEGEEKKQGVLEKLHRSDSSSSSSSEEEEGDKKKKKKKKGLKEKIKEKMTGEKEEEEEKKGEEETKTTVSSILVTAEEDTSVTVEKVDCTTEQVQVLESSSAMEEKKAGLFDKIKEKLPGHPKKTTSTEDCTPSAAPTAVEHEGDLVKEKKGFLGKIMGKIPGYHKSAKTTTTTGDHGGDQGGAAH